MAALSQHCPVTSMGYGAGTGPPPATGAARKRWASISDDDASPMLWPLRSPGLRGRRSLSSTPLVGPSIHQGSAGTGLAKVVEHQAVQHQAVPSSPFMLPTAHPTSTMTDPNAMAAWGGMYGVYAGAQQQVNAWNTARTWGCMPAPGAWVQAGGYPAPAAYQAVVQQQTAPAGRGSVTAAMGGGTTTTIALGAAAGSGADRGPRKLNGWTVIWVGERAFRATAAMKEQIEVLGFLLKVYRSYDKCCRALDKKTNISSTNAFLLSAADSEPMFQYLCNRGAGDLRIVVDAEGSSPAEVQHLISGVVHPQETAVTIANSWDEVLAGLSSVNMEASARLPDSCEVRQAVVETEGMELQASDAPWTLVWISDQAFKPAATGLKAQLESLGCQVKGYKTHKNAARALDKKRALARTVVLVSGAEAAPFLAYLGARPEIASTQVVIEASSRAVPLRETPNCQVVENFDQAVAAVWKIAADPGFA